MKYLTFIIALMLITIYCEAQDDLSNIIKIETGNWVELSAEIIDIDEEEITYNVIEELPKYPGGFDSLANYLINTIQYPDNAINDSVQGRVVTSFDLDTLGKISNVLTIESVRNDLDSACISAILSMPDWIPAKRKKNINVLVRFSLPIRFILNSKK